jgi:hypothetical protein
MTESSCTVCHHAPAHLVRLTTTRRHGTYIHEALRLHIKHTQTIDQGFNGVNLRCLDCGGTVIEAGNNGRFTAEYEREACRVPGYQP